MKEVHLTIASIPGVRCLREMKASTNKRSRDSTYMVIAKTVALISSAMPETAPAKQKTGGNSKAVPVRTTEEARHRIASTLEGKVKNPILQSVFLQIQHRQRTPRTQMTLLLSFRFRD